jgi:16S rRNA (uracil1498-N3)-methyltransferase
MVDEAWCASAGAVAHVFVDELGDTVDVAGSDGHHLQRVRRLRPDEVVTAADGTGAWRAYRVASSSAGRLVLDAHGEIRAEPELQPFVSVAVALTKSGIEHVVARCTELGVDRIEPVRARRSVVRWDEAKAAAAVARMRTIAREAAAQSRRARLPEIVPVAPIETLAGRPGLCIADRTGVAAVALAPPGPEGFTVVVGPEGGFDADDLSAFPASVPRLAVGPHVLRAETAPIAVVAALRGAWASPAV